MFNGIGPKDWLIGLFTGGLWILYKLYKNGLPLGKIVGGYLVLVILVGLIGGGDKEKNTTSNSETKTETVVAEKKVDNSEAERVAKEKAAAERLAKEKVEAEKSKPFQIQYTITSTFKSVMKIEPTDSSYMIKTKNDMNRKAKTLSNKTDYYIDYKDGNLFVSTKTYSDKKIYGKNEYEIDVSKISDIVISKGTTKDKVVRGIMYFQDSYNLDIYGSVDSYKNKYSFSNNRLINNITFDSIESLEKLKNKLIIANNKITLHNEKDFTKEIFLKEKYPLCENGTPLMIAAVSDGAKFDKMMEVGKCISTNKVDKKAFIEEKEYEDYDARMVKVSEYGNIKFLWILKNGYR